MRNIWSLKGGFALPTVLIASVVMLMVLTVSVSSVVAIRTALQTQYYEQLAKTAGEAGVAYAKACLAKNGNVPLWSDVKPLTPATDCAGNVLLTPALDILVVGGGGGGGGTIAGGGGGGGVVQQSDYAVSTGTYTVTVGGGGSGGRGWDNAPVGGSSGANSAFAGIVAIGGGGGGGHDRAAGLVGGSGGGAVLNRQTGGAGTAGQGFAGGSHPSNNGNNTGGGGGAGGVGQDSTTTKSGDGGPGVASAITGAVTYYGGGGGGGVRTGYGAPGAGGIGGGGAGTNASVAAVAGLANTGGGGGGAGYTSNSTAYLGGSGGSGIVVVRYPLGTLSATGGSKVNTGLYTTHTFTSSGTLTVTATGTATCPTDPRCSVMVDGNVRSSFKIGMPTLNSEGKAVAIPNTGYVELLRASNGSVWRTYRQPSVQAAVVPGLCTGAATSSLGWSNAVITSTQSVLPNAPAARNISLTNGSLAAGQVYFRRDFVVNMSGTYTFSANTPSPSSAVELFINGTPVTVAQGSPKSGSLPLTPGCYTATARLTNKTIMPTEASFIAALQLNGGGSSSIMTSDSEWRVSTGALVDFSSPDFYADPDVWTSVTGHTTATAQYANSSWQNVQADIWTRMISVAGSGCAASCPATSYGYLRDSRDFIIPSTRDVLVSSICDDNCVVYIDGNPVIGSSPWGTIAQQTVTLNAGVHRVGVRVYNAAVGSSGVGVSVIDKTSNAILTRTDQSWLGANAWFTSVPANPSSYETSFLPSPAEIVDPTLVDVLVVAGGGGGGGNCSGCGGGGGGGGGGVVYRPGKSVTPGTYAMVIGTGGAGGPAGTQAGGTNGNNSSFMGLTALGGGAGMGQNGAPGKNGGSGGGGSGGSSPAPGAGGSGTTGQGFGGGAGIVSPYGGGGGGGAGGWGFQAIGSISGNGGAGLITYIDGTRRSVGAGGGGGTYGSAYYAGSGETGVAGNGSATGVGGGGWSNTGGGGGGANGNPSGQAGGPGGSGVVYLRFKTGSVTMGTISGLAYSTSTVTISGINYTVYRFTGGTGSVTISAVN